MFSVIIPLYNKELSIKNTLQSVLDQSYSNFEIVIVNDGSTDNSVQVVSGIKDSRIRLIHQENQGVSAARNRGIKEAKNEWIAFLDGDDYWKNNHLKETVSMIKKFPTVKVFATTWEHTTSSGPRILENRPQIYKVENYFKEAWEEVILWTGVVAVKKACFKEVGGFDENLKYGEDLYMWAKLARKYNIVKNQKITVIYRLDAENRSNRSFELSKSIVYQYSFDEASSKDEVEYFRVFIASAMWNFLKRREFKNFLRLKRKHRNYISYIDILRSKLKVRQVSLNRLSNKA